MLLNIPQSAVESEAGRVMLASREAVYPPESYPGTTSAIALCYIIDGCRGVQILVAQLNIRTALEVRPPVLASCGLVASHRCLKILTQS